MAQFPALDIWTDAWLADTGHLPRVDRDIYFHLMILMWRTPNCRVPNDMDWISRKLRCTENEVQIIQSVASEFCESDGNWLTQKRLTKEYKAALQRSKYASDNAKRRWDKEKNISNGIANTIEPSIALTATATITDTVKERKKDTTYLSKEKRGSRLSDDFLPDASCHDLADKLLLTNQDCHDALDNFMDYWRAVPGAKGLKLDWNLTFKNQLRHVAKIKGKPNGKNNTNTIKGGFDIIDAAFEQARLRQSGIRETDGSENSQDIPRLLKITP
jgi:uncharacterized protein YdaU (DUF1376 family)